MGNLIKFINEFPFFQKYLSDIVDWKWLGEKP